MSPDDSADLLWEIPTPIGIRVRLTATAWRTIETIKHPVMAGRQQDVAAALRGPAQIRRSRVAEDVYLFYGGERPGRWLCVVVKVVDGYGFVITCYLTDAIKIGAPVWTR